MISLGIDPSTKATGIVVLQGDKWTMPALLHAEVVPSSTKKFDNARANVERIAAARKRFKPGVVTIEGYGLNLRNKHAIIPLITLGAVIRYHFALEGLSYLEPTPSEHKLFLTDNGNTKKEKVGEFVAARWGYETKDNNLSDAYGLALIGLAQRNALPDINDSQMTVLMRLKTVR